MASDVTLTILFFQIVNLFVHSLADGDEYDTITKPLYLDDNYYFELLDPASISYTYKIRPAKNFGPHLNTTYWRIPLVPTEPLDACTTITNSIYLQDAVALIERGGCSFLSKTVQAEAAGAVMTIIADHSVANDQYMVDMVQDETSRSVNIAAFFMLGKDGYMIRQAISDNGLQGALINIPLNMTGVTHGRLNQPPWSLW